MFRSRSSTTYLAEGMRCQPVVRVTSFTMTSLSWMPEVVGCAIRKALFPAFYQALPVLPQTRFDIDSKNAPFAVIARYDLITAGLNAAINFCKLSAAPSMVASFGRCAFEE